MHLALNMRVIQKYVHTVLSSQSSKVSSDFHYHNEDFFTLAATQQPLNSHSVTS